MPSRRRTANKNLANNLAEVQRRLRTLERRPVRSKLGNRSVSGTAISPNSVDSTQVSFGINLVAQVDPITGNTEPILNPQDGQQVFDPYSGTTNTYFAEYDTYVETSSTDAVAQSLANSALSTADGKSKIFYAASAPVSDSTYTLKSGDLWFDTSNGYRLSQYVSTPTPGWTQFKLGSKAIDKIEANQILAGEITATLTIRGPEVISGQITGATFRTSADSEGRRIIISNNDDILFYKDVSTLAGVITPVSAGWSGSDPNATSPGDYVLTGGVQITGSEPSIQGGPAYPAVVAAGDATTGFPGAYLIGAADSSLSVYDTGFYYSGPANSYGYVSADIISLVSGYGGNQSQYVEIVGPLVLSEDSTEGPIMYGTGIPTVSGTVGQIIFRYT